MLAGNSNKCGVNCISSSNRLTKVESGADQTTAGCFCGLISF